MVFQETRDCSTLYYRGRICYQALWLRKLLCDLDLKQLNETEVFVDNQAAIAISHNPVFHGKTKHFKIKFFFLR